MQSKLNRIEMRKFETKEEIVEWIEILHLQNTNGRETEGEMFRMGIEAAIEELTELNLLSIPTIVATKGELSNLEKAIKKAKPNMDKIKDVDKHIDSIR